MNSARSCKRVKTVLQIVAERVIQNVQVKTLKKKQQQQQAES